VPNEPGSRPPPTQDALLAALEVASDRRPRQPEPPDRVILPRQRLSSAADVFMRQPFTVHVGIAEQSQGDLPEIVLATDFPRHLAGRLDCGQQEGDQDRDDRDRHEHLRQGERAALGHGLARWRFARVESMSGSPPPVLVADHVSPASAYQGLQG
jgi:hypothetical protein